MALKHSVVSSLAGSHVTLQVRHVEIEGGSFNYDVITRPTHDAVAVILLDGDQVWLRQCLRPPIADTLHHRSGMLWELPAGMLETADGGDPREAAARETFEETGFKLQASDFSVLGEPVFSCPGLIAECVHFCVADVSGHTRAEPPGDGSLVESLACLALRHIIPMPEVFDMKTELGLRRLMISRAGVS